ncbi:bifunctional adenosylcobinamide kinase/adenosylcobinamide-phosphate guanylyltransferase, partial [Frankia sp. Cpl3]|nr:bifunctional adenosylcobinamide kinase/adenosylcobinamide-phosphate guanylyltransferase [Frankia sp. Cpl3]
MRLVFITGGVRSGKSRFGETLAQRNSSVLYIATGIVGDSELEKRVQLHQERRPCHWDTLETADSLLEGLPHYMRYDSVLVDCLSAWISNLLMSVPEENIGDAKVEERIRRELINWLEA